MGAAEAVVASGSWAPCGAAAPLCPRRMVRCGARLGEVPVRLLPGWPGSPIYLHGPERILVSNG